MTRNLYEAIDGEPAGQDNSPGCLHLFGEEEIWIPDVYCEDCGERLIAQPSKDDNGKIYIKVYECTKSCHIRWEYEGKLIKAGLL
jgi:hypothetical protein